MTLTHIKQCKQIRQQTMVKKANRRKIQLPVLWWVENVKLRLTPNLVTRQSRTERVPLCIRGFNAHNSNYGHIGFSLFHSDFSLNCLCVKMYRSTTSTSSILCTQHYAHRFVDHFKINIKWRVVISSDSHCLGGENAITDYQSSYQFFLFIFDFWLKIDYIGQTIFRSLLQL